MSPLSHPIVELGANSTAGAGLWLDGVSDSDAYTNNMWEWGRAGMNDTAKVSFPCSSRSLFIG